MKCSELQIGDWVQGFVPDSYSRVYGIFNEQRIAVIAEPSKAYIELSVDDIQPIPLTPEILEKNGFSKLEHGWILKKIGMEVCVEFIAEKWSLVIQNELALKDEHGRADLVTFCHDWFKAFYVHELQHALRLCGIEKEIVVC